MKGYAQEIDKILGVLRQKNKNMNPVYLDVLITSLLPLTLIDSFILQAQL